MYVQLPYVEKLILHLHTADCVIVSPNLNIEGDTDVEFLNIGEILGSYSRVVEDSGLLGCDVIAVGE
jgi:hypothetical protein